MNSRILTLQFAFFFKDIIPRPDEEFKNLNDNMLNIFNTIPQTMPLPPGVPAEIPVQILRSEANNYICNIARSRVDLTVQRVDDISNIELLKDFNVKVQALTKYLTNLQKIVRFGMVARYFHHEDDPISCIHKKYFHSEVIKGSGELAIRFNNKDEAYGFKINDVVEISSGEMDVNGKVNMGIIVQRDINNDPIKGIDLTYDKLLQISKKFSPRLGEKLIEELIR